MAHTDGAVTGAEQEYLEKMIGNISRVHTLSDAQKQTLWDDLKHGNNPEEFFNKITNPEDRGQAVYFIGLMAAADGHTDNSEFAVIERLREKQMAGIDLNVMQQKIREAVQDSERARAEEREGLRIGFFGVIDRFLSKLGVDILK
jgi:uncharacterized membrane protein YebE (DUF533 family)